MPIQIGIITPTSSQQISMSLSLTNNNDVFMPVDRSSRYPQDKTNTLILNAQLGFEGPDAATDITGLKAWDISNDGDIFTFTDEFSNDWTGVGSQSSGKTGQNSYIVDLSMELNYTYSGTMPDVTPRVNASPIPNDYEKVQVVTRNKNGAMRLSGGSGKFLNVDYDIPRMTNTDFLSALGYLGSKFYEQITVQSHLGSITGLLVSSNINFTLIENNNWQMSPIRIERAVIV